MTSVPDDLQQVIEDYHYQRPEIEYVQGGFKVGRKTYRYRINGKPANSVTEILDCVFGDGKFGAGAWWGQQVGISGIAYLADQGFVLPYNDPQALLELLKKHRKTTNDVRDYAADRGTAIHDAAEQWARQKIVPNPAAFPDDQQGYVRALARFMIEQDPEFLATEVVVGSSEWDYAGTYDARVVIDGRVGIIDWKTSKRVYLSHLFQVRAYDEAAIECGADPADFRAVVHLGAEGAYQIEESQVTPDQWYNQVSAFQTQIEAKNERRR